MESSDERAAYYNAHKDDREVWEEAGERSAPRPRGGLSATITVRFSPEEAGAIRRLARARNVHYSDIVRDAVRAYAHPGALVERGQITQFFYAGPGDPKDRMPHVTLEGDLRKAMEPPTRSIAAAT
jgi:hypothetical protein